MDHHPELYRPDSETQIERRAENCLRCALRQGCRIQTRGTGSEAAGSTLLTPPLGQGESELPKGQKLGEKRCYAHVAPSFCADNNDSIDRRWRLVHQLERTERSEKTKCLLGGKNLIVRYLQASTRRMGENVMICGSLLAPLMVRLNRSISPARRSSWTKHSSELG